MALIELALIIELYSSVESRRETLLAIGSSLSSLMPTIISPPSLLASYS